MAKLLGIFLIKIANYRKIKVISYKKERLYMELSQITSRFHYLKKQLIIYSFFNTISQKIILFFLSI